MVKHVFHLMTVFYAFFYSLRCFIHSVIIFKTFVEKVCSIVAYLFGNPVLLSWNKWFKFSSCFVSTSSFPFSFKIFSIISRFSFGGTCKSFDPLRARTGHLVLLKAFEAALSPIVKHHLRRIGQKVGMQGTQICLICRWLQHLRTQPKGRREGVGVIPRTTQLRIINRLFFCFSDIPIFRRLPSS